MKDQVHRHVFKTYFLSSKQSIPHLLMRQQIPQIASYTVDKKSLLPIMFQS